MSIEVAVFALRLLAGLSLVGYLMALFFVILRNEAQAGLRQRLRSTSHAFLQRLEPPDESGQRLALGALFTLGRGAGNSLVLSDDYASAQHAQIEAVNGQYWLQDRDSRNGTFLNGDAIAQRTALADGDIIGIGRHRFRLELST